MIHCPMNYSDNKFYKSLGEGGTPSGWGGQVWEDRWKLGRRLVKWVGFRQGEGKGESALGMWHSLCRSICCNEWSVSQTFLERFLETVRKKEEQSVSSWRREWHIFGKKIEKAIWREVMICEMPWNGSRQKT